MIHNSHSITTRYNAALNDAAKRLSSLEVANGRPIKIKGLSGWIFEQTVRTCLEEELSAQGISPTIEDQVPIGGRASADLKVGCAVIEIKAAGFFGGDEGTRYLGYRNNIEAKGWHYLYLTLHETYRPYVEVAQNAFGKEKAFFLDQGDSWESFVSTVIRLS